MTQEQHDQVVAFVKSRGLVMMRSHGYVNTFASVYEDDGKWFIKDNVWAPEPLLDYRFSDLSFYKRVEKIDG